MSLLAPVEPRQGNWMTSEFIMYYDQLGHYHDQQHEATS